MRRVTSDSGLLAELLEEGYDFFTGVPDSGLKSLIADAYELPPAQHVPATWEAEAVATAAGAALAGRKPCVYLQNAGLGHTVNPLASLCVPTASTCCWWWATGTRCPSTGSWAKSTSGCSS